jgi:iron complex outermembrane receptor protein
MLVLVILLIKSKIQTLLVKLTLSAQNVLVITNYSGLDPEISGGIDNNLYPRPLSR